jgi:hypothetical protein
MVLFLKFFSPLLIFSGSFNESYHYLEMKLKKSSLDSSIVNLIIPQK